MRFHFGMCSIPEVGINSLKETENTYGIGAIQKESFNSRCLEKSNPFTSYRPTNRS